MLIRRILREKFIENNHTINSYLEYGPNKDDFLKGKESVYITYSTGRKRGKKSKKQKYNEETKQDLGYQHSVDYEKVGFDDEVPDATGDNNHRFDPEDYNIFKREKVEEEVDEIKE
jgi:superfamily II DNA helicase RecQ